MLMIKLPMYRLLHVIDGRNVSNFHLALRTSRGLLAVNNLNFAKYVSSRTNAAGEFSSASGTVFIQRRFSSPLPANERPWLSRTPKVLSSRFASSQSPRSDFQQKSTNVRSTNSLLYLSGGIILVFGFSYAAVPLYRVFCQATGYGGEVRTSHDSSKVETMTKVPQRLIKVTFNADTGSSIAWKFVPQQSELNVSPGETALAFYTATNELDVPVIGIATYNVVPFEAGQYFNKIQCFCFEEQRLNPLEQVDMPVFFYIDPDFANDPKMENVDTLTLSYTFFEAKKGISIPVPSYARH